MTPAHSWALPILRADGHGPPIIALNAEFPIHVEAGIGIAAAIVTVAIWTNFIIVARAMALKTLTPFDIAFYG